MRKFYKQADARQVEGGWQVHLDGRGVKTPATRPQIVPTESLALALAEEWNRQGEKIDPKSFLFRDHADFAIDMVAPSRDEVIDKLVSYGETDTLCYRADPEDALYARQQEVWEPLLGHLEVRHGIRFQRVSGIMHKPQPPETLDKLRQHLASLDDFTLGGLTAMASLAASLSIALLAIDEDVNDTASLWRDASLEEEWQADLWGRDSEAEAQRERRWQDFSAAAAFVDLAKPGA
ncbi:Chaperone required for the assembly of the mitochondrial F1-ATPase [Altererythrobacter epoxidivorans]|uniref:Chaperone required for the assembly of the mitochondrial F1-ATPase n=1 Tax=Altererythrobacter epoxidivorans TaxID=361183 RepID=A0A0M3TAR9_9SPHN|nr:ATP12 family protein [Altererythrobacter epoxidivorans]ALE17256.1 Chaperone required for the assembly of the mitochondrial F1-ATPase [Altererythrobacter epoxidivorans]